MPQVRAATVLALIARALLSSAVARLLGINHVALEVDDVDAALNWYGRFFGFELRGRAGARMAFVDLGDQFVALSAGRSQEADEARHVGFVVDDKEAVRAALLEGGVSVRRSGRLDFLDPWGNHIRGRGLPRHPVHEGARGAGRDGRRRAVEVRGGARGAAPEGDQLAVGAVSSAARRRRRTPRRRRWPATSPATAPAATNGSSATRGRETKRPIANAASAAITNPSRWK